VQLYISDCDWDANGCILAATVTILQTTVVSLRLLVMWQHWNC